MKSRFKPRLVKLQSLPQRGPLVYLGGIEKDEATVSDPVRP